MCVVCWLCRKHVLIAQGAGANQECLTTMMIMKYEGKTRVKENNVIRSVDVYICARDSGCHAWIQDYCIL